MRGTGSGLGVFLGLGVALVSGGCGLDAPVAAERHFRVGREYLAEFMGEAKPGQRAPEVLRLTVDACLRRARRDSPKLKLSRDALQAALLGVEQAQAAYWPVVSASVRAATTLRQIKEFSEEQILGSVDLNYNLFNLLYRQGVLDVAVVLLEKQRRQHDATAEEVAYEVIERFYQTKRYEAQKRQAEIDLKKARLAADEVRTRREHGKASTLEVQRVEASVAQLELHHLVLRRSLEESQRALSRALGLDEQTRVALLDDAPEEFRFPDLEHCLKVAYEHRDDLRVFELDLVLAELDLERLAVQQYPQPTLSVGLISGLSPSRAPSGADIDLFINAGITVPLFDGGSMQRRLAMAEQRLQAMKSAHRHAVRKMMDEVRDSYRDLEIKKLAFKLQSAETELTCQRVETEIGVIRRTTGDLAEITRLESERTQALNAGTNARYDMILAAAKLRQKMGRLSASSGYGADSPEEAGGEPMGAGEER